MNLFLVTYYHFNVVWGHLLSTHWQLHAIEGHIMIIAFLQDLQQFKYFTFSSCDLRGPVMATFAIEGHIMIIAFLQDLQQFKYFTFSSCDLRGPVMATLASIVPVCTGKRWQDLQNLEAASLLDLQEKI